MSALVPVLAAPMIDPGAGRIAFDVPEGMTIMEIVGVALPGFVMGRRDLRVTLVTPAGAWLIEQEAWDRVRPKPGVQVVIRVVPGKNFASILQIVVSVAALAIGQFFGPMLASAFGGFSATTWGGIVGLGVTVLGGLLINSLIKPKDQDKDQSFQITGWSNQLRPDGVVPALCGTFRYMPPFAATSYYEVVGDILYNRALFLFGYGELSITDLRVGDTSISEYDEIDIEIREGLSTDGPVTIYPRQVVEEQVGAELARPKPRNDAGNVIDGDSIETPVIRATGPDASGACVILSFPTGLGKVDKEGDKKDLTVEIRIRQRLSGATTWQDVVTLEITAKKFEALFRQYAWNFPTRGRWEIELTRMTAERTSTQSQDRSQWVALQTLRPEYPINISKPMALVAVRVKSTYQLNGQLDTLNGLAARRCLDWDSASQTWIKRTTSNPASIFRWALQSVVNPKPVADAGIDLAQLQDWHAFCKANNLHFDGVFEEEITFRDMLSRIASAGRATQRHDGVKWGVAIDRPQAMLPVDEVNTRNGWNFQTTRNYVEPPHGFRVKFFDQTWDYKQAERLVPWPGHTGDITLTEALELPGKTDPAEVYLEARRRMYEAIYRPDVHTCVQGGAARVATRGDMVMTSIDILERTQKAARVVSTSGNLVEIDDEVTMESGKTYALRFRIGLDEDDTIGTSVLRSVLTVPGTSRALVITSPGLLPPDGSIVHFGESGNESSAMIITRMEAGDDFSTVFRMMDAAPIIDDKMATEVAPAWSGRVGAEIDENLLAPPAPRFTSVASGYAAGDDGTTIAVDLTPGSGPIAAMSFTVQHRISGSGAWSSITFPVANGGTTIAGYARGAVVQVKAFAISASGTAGPETAIVSVTIGADDAGLPSALDASLIAVGAVLGGAVITMSTVDDAFTTSVQVYRSTSSTLNTTTDAVGEPKPVEASRSYSWPDGDITRENLLTNPGFTDSSVWTLGNGWSIGSGIATHASGLAGLISQPLAAVSGKWYRVAFTVSAYSAGILTPRFAGGSNRDGTSRSANGNYSDRIQAVTGNTTFGIVASSITAGSIDNIVLFQETSTCLAAGTYYYWLEPQNDDGVAGAVVGPFTVTIR